MTNQTKQFEVVVSANESMHGCAPLGDVVAKFTAQADAEVFAADHAALLKMSPTKAKFVIVACDGLALWEEALS